MPLSLSLSDFGFTSFCTLTLLMLETEPLELDLDPDFETDLDFDFDLDLDLDELVCLERGLLLRDRGDLDRLPFDARDDREDADELLLLLLELEERECLPDFGLELAELLLLVSFLIAALSSSESSLIRLKSMSTSLSLSSAMFSTV